ncbi:MAG: SDR family NAD(P)-dependent oxidoreductase [Clostridiales bacterium]|jgi:short-chain dehydrogenases of various substrate specificities|nr:SDR family NAD(P)-dependent oxidoreductase [Clostridiales bacterium]
MKIVIIGACSKIGMEYVKLLSKKENDLILIDNDKENLINIQNKYKNKVNMQIIASDIISESKIKELYIFIRKENPEFIINNLTFYNNDKFFDSDSKETHYEYQLNSLYLFSKLFLKDMIKNNKGYILNTLSIDFYNQNILNADYLGLEAYLKELTRYVNKVLKKDKLNICFSSLLLKNRKDLNTIAKYSLKKINSRNTDIKLKMLYNLYKIFNKEK